MKIGIQGHHSNQHSIDRNIAGLVEGCTYIRVHDIYEVIRKFRRVAARAVGYADVNLSDVECSFSDFDINKVDVLHLFNTVSFGETPWISTFETILPRYQNTLACHHGREPDYFPLKFDRKIRRALDAMSRPSCKGIIAISNCNADIQKEMLRQFPECSEIIEKKMLILHPPQVAFVCDYESKRLPEGGPIRFMFVGGSFFRKGGMQMLHAFQRAKDEGYDLTLTIVSSLVIDDYATKETRFDVDEAERLIHANRDWIVYHRSLPNQQVLDLMKASHVGLLPTYADTYGYSALEFQACGCPVISTDVRALPEINDDTTGWTIKLNKNGMGEAIYTTEHDRSEIGSAITSGITSIVRSIFGRRTAIRLKAEAALERIRNYHAPDRHAARLREIYLGAVAKPQ